MFGSVQNQNLVLNMSSQSKNTSTFVSYVFVLLLRVMVNPLSRNKGEEGQEGIVWGLVGWGRGAKDKHQGMQCVLEMFA